MNLHPITNPRVVGVLTEGDGVVHPASLAVVRHLAPVLHSPRSSLEGVPRDALAPRDCGGKAVCKALPKEATIRFFTGNTFLKTWYTITDFTI